MQVCAIIRTSMRLTTFRTKNTCIYVQYVQIRANTSQHTYIIRAYTYFIFAKIRAHTADRMCTYCKYVQVYACILHVYVYVCKMYVYASMGKYVHVCKKFLNHTVYARICMYI